MPGWKQNGTGANLMADSTNRNRGGSRAFAVIAVAASLVALPACESLRTEPHPEPVARSSDPAPASVAVVTPPGKFATRSGCCVFYTDFELDRHEPLFAELEILPEEIAAELKLPPPNTIVQVFLFDSQERYEQFMFTPKVGRYRNQPPRRAYFFAEPRVGGMDDLKIYTWMGDPATLRTDLRHELTHAILHSILKDVPLWLDEGLASYFELPPRENGVNPQHLEMLSLGQFQPDLGRLEQLDQVKQMQKPEYREAWAWVHFMLRGHPAAREVLHRHLQDLRGHGVPGPLLPKLREVIPNPEQALQAHIQEIELSAH